MSQEHCETCHAEIARDGERVSAFPRRCDRCWLDHLCRCGCGELMQPWQRMCDRCADEMACEYQDRDHAAFEAGEIK